MRKLFLTFLTLLTITCYSQSDSIINVMDAGLLPNGNPMDSMWPVIKNTGHIFYFPTGTYTFKRWVLTKDSITIYGDGPGKTILRFLENGLEMSVYRNGGWDLSQAIPYKDSVLAGQKYIDLRDIADSSKFSPGAKFYINAGASYYDQYYGEFNIVDRVVGRRVYLKYSIVKDLNYARSSGYGSVATTFTAPAYGQSTTCTITNPPALNVKYISFNNDLYQITAASGTSITITNISPTNTLTTIPAGTPVYRGRSIYFTPTSSYNVVVKDLTIVTAPNKLLTISNSIKTRFDNIEFHRLAGTTAKGLWLDGDDGRDCEFTNCSFTADSLMYSQIARSFTGIHFDHCKFNQCAVNFSEFASDCSITNSEFSMGNDGGTNVGFCNPIQIGWTTTNIRIQGNNIYADGMNNAISSFSDINTYSASPGGAIINDNVITVKDCKTVLSMGSPGVMDVNNNKMYGTTLAIFSGNGRTIDTLTGRTSGNTFIRGTLLTFNNNSFVGDFDFVYQAYPYNVNFTNNYIYQRGEYTPGGNSSARGFGNIIYNHGNAVQPGKIENVNFTNNTFEHFYYLANSFNYNKLTTKNLRVKINNNLFKSNIGPGNTSRDFIVNTY